MFKGLNVLFIYVIISRFSYIFLFFFFFWIYFNFVFSVSRCHRPLSRTTAPLQVSSPHLARSYHHLFPVPQFEEVSAAAVAAAAGTGAAGAPGAVAGNSTVVRVGQGAGAGPRGKQSSPPPGGVAGAVGVTARVSCAGCLRDLAGLARYRCPECGSNFCLDCDMYVHDSLHNCPGCC